MTPLQIAVLGPGKISANQLVPALARVTTARLRSVLSRDLDRARALAEPSGATPYTDLAALLADPGLDAVIIATPDRLHAPQAIAAARAGKHILCEKPMATSPDEARAMVEAAAAADVRLGVAYHLRWNMGHRLLRARVVAGELGELRHMRVQWTYRAPDASNWRASDDVGRWWGLAGVGTHALDLVRWFMVPSCGEVVAVRSLITRPVWKGPHDETALVMLRFASGATAEIVTSVLFDSDPRVEINGTAGAAICTGTLGPQGAGAITVAGKPLDFKPVNPYVGEIADFVAAIREHRPPEVDGAEGARNVELLAEAAPPAIS